MSLRRPSLLTQIADNLRALTSGQIGEDNESHVHDSPAGGKVHERRPVFRRDAPPATHLPDRARQESDAPSDRGRSSERVDDVGESLHVSPTLHYVAYNVNTTRNVVTDTLEPVATQGERLLALQKAAGFSTLAEFARAAGIEPGTARQQANRDSIPKDAAAKYAGAARGTGASAEWLLFGTGAPPRATALTAVPSTRPSSAPPRARAVHETPPQGKPDVPVWASAEAGDDGAIILMPDPIDYVHRSERLRGVKSPFAFYVIGDSMSPAIEHGDQVVINPTIPVRGGVDCVFIEDQPDGSMRALVKRLLRATADVWRVRQFSPSRDFELSRRKWSKAHVISEIRRGGL